GCWTSDALQRRCTCRAFGCWRRQRRRAGPRSGWKTSSTAASRTCDCALRRRACAMLEPDTDALVKRFQDSRPKTLRSDCPAPERLWEAALGKLSVEELRQVTTHTARCAECSEALRIALELQRAAAAGAAPGNVIPLRMRRQRLVAVYGAGLLAAGLAAVVWVHGRDVPSPALMPDAERGEAAAAIVSRTAPGRQPRDAVVLRWTPYP